jgi:hypothetical protein
MAVGSGCACTIRSRVAARHDLQRGKPEKARSGGPYWGEFEPIENRKQKQEFVEMP